MNHLTTIASLPMAGGCMSSLPPEKTDPPKVQMRAAYFEEALKLPEIDASLIGEAGPELHIPNTAGKIVNVVVNFTVGDVATVNQVRNAVAGSEARRTGRFVPPVLLPIDPKNIAYGGVVGKTSSGITKETMEQLGRNLDRRRAREAHRYSERFQNDERN